MKISIATHILLKIKKHILGLHQLCDTGRSSDGENVPVSVSCGHFHYFEPPLDWTTDGQANTMMDTAAETEDRQQLGHTATDRVDEKPSAQTQSQGQVPDDRELLTPIRPGTLSTGGHDNTGDLDFITIPYHVRCDTIQYKILACAQMLTGGQVIPY